MYKPLFALLTLAALSARADRVAGSIDDPALRRKTQLVYVETAPGKFAPPAAPAVMDQTRNTFQPKLLPVLAGQAVSFRSNDPELHNVNARAGKQSWPSARIAGGGADRPFDAADCCRCHGPARCPV